MNVCFVDTETAGLHPDNHPIWEVALITPDGREHVWQFPIVEIEADPFALQVGHYWERHWDSELIEIRRGQAVYDADTSDSRRQNFPDQGLAIEPGEDWARYFQSLTADCHLAGAVVSFDEERLRRLLWKHGVLHRWHYHLIDVEALAAGWLRGRAADVDDAAPGSARVAADAAIGRPPWDSKALSGAVGVEPGEFDRHTAIGDARWAKAIYEAVMGS